MGFKVESFNRKEDDLEVEDNEVFQELLGSGKELWLVAKAAPVETPVDIQENSLIPNHLEGDNFSANSLDSQSMY